MRIKEQKVVFEHKRYPDGRIVPYTDLALSDATRIYIEKGLFWYMVSAYGWLVMLWSLVHFKFSFLVDDLISHPNEMFFHVILFYICLLLIFVYINVAFLHEHYTARAVGPLCAILLMFFVTIGVCMLLDLWAIFNGYTFDKSFCITIGVLVGLIWLGWSWRVDSYFEEYYPQPFWKSVGFWVGIFVGKVSFFTPMKYCFYIGLIYCLWVHSKLYPWLWPQEELDKLYTRGGFLLNKQLFDYLIVEPMILYTFKALTIERGLWLFHRQHIGHRLGLIDPNNWHISERQLDLLACCNKRFEPIDIIVSAPAIQQHIMETRSTGFILEVCTRRGFKYSDPLPEDLQKFKIWAFEDMDSIYVTIRRRRMNDPNYEPKLEDFVVVID